MRADPGPGDELNPLVEIVPNFSEGRRQDVIDAIVAALRVPGVTLREHASGTPTTTGWTRACRLAGRRPASALAGAAKAAAS